jgi:hypothetical protein
MTKVLSTYLNQHTGLCVACSDAFFSKSSMKKFAISGKSGEIITILLVCSYSCPSKQKYVDVSMCLNSARTSSSKC